MPSSWADPATEQPHTDTINPAPLILYDPPFNGSLKNHGTLADVAPTLITMLELEQRPEMSGQVPPPGEMNLAPMTPSSRLVTIGLCL